MRARLLVRTMGSTVLVASKADPPVPPEGPNLPTVGIAILLPFDLGLAFGLARYCPRLPSSVNHRPGLPGFGGGADGNALFWGKALQPLLCGGSLSRWQCRV